ncbi:dihydrodipicolinate synthase family protein [Rhodococcus ruber]|uniref:Dihydrodipicolinate synthase family protein n=1 Tax=Rhodococcus ruber TaxID=1830 RepID=A0ABT4MKE2_9NOCA|nr:dihydrodipicolinate synthase family protein [Rhodococcus ruber]MCZ4520505.1 dihydrodipicolinate synthase family protein [Rhodococcus ruber]
MINAQRALGHETGVVAWGMVPTPFDCDGRLDAPSLRRIVRHLLDNGCDGLIALGVIAEPLTLTAAEKSEILETIESVAGGVPVVASVLALESGSFGTEFATLTAKARRSVSAVMIPVTASSAEGVRASVATAHEAAGVPVIVQDLPRFSGVEISPHHLAAALNESPECIAVKCEAMPTYERIEYLDRNTRVELISGFGGLGVVDDVIAGASAVAIGTTATREVATAIRLALVGRYHEAAAVVGRAATRIHYETQTGPNIAIRKHHWMQAGIIETDVVRPPTRRFEPALRKHAALYSCIVAGPDPDASGLGP